MSAIPAREAMPMVDEPMRTILQPVPISLSDKLKEGVTTFSV